jgi:hypothetical protein
METLNANMERDASVMHIITIVTLIYLPATFTSVSPSPSNPDLITCRTLNLQEWQTFFSTDIIKYQDPSGGKPRDGVFSKVALFRWLQVAVPLTLLTLILAWTMFKVTMRSRFTTSRSLWMTFSPLALFAYLSKWSVSKWPEWRAHGGKKLLPTVRDPMQLQPFDGRSRLTVTGEGVIQPPSERAVRSAV